MASKSQKRAAIKKKIWPHDEPFQTPKKGFFQPPRTLPLLLALMKYGKVSGNQDPSSVYLELLSHLFDNGVIEINNQVDHAYAAGYWGERGLRTWLERMNWLEQKGFIKSQGAGAQRFRYVFIADPQAAIDALDVKGLVPTEWKTANYSRGLEYGAISEDEPAAKAPSKKVVDLSTVRMKKAAPRKAGGRKADS